jgi:hypothetical protein
MSRRDGRRGASGGWKRVQTRDAETPGVAKEALFFQRFSRSASVAVRLLFQASSWNDDHGKSERDHS